MRNEFRQLTVADLRRSNVPRRFWKVSLSNIPDHLEYKGKIESYINQMDELFSEGVGLYLWSKENSTGKTSASVVILKYALRMRRTTFFEESGRLKNNLISEYEFEDNVSLERRVRTVDLLVLDDVGKEYRTNSGFAENVLENILRDRAQSMKATIMTSNLPPSEIESVYSPDMSAILRETMIPIEFDDYDWRAEKADKLRDFLE